jgi:hypothetical protein
MLLRVVAAAAAGEQFQRRGVHQRRLRRARRLRGGVQDHMWNAELGEPDRRGQPGGTGTDDHHLGRLGTVNRFPGVVHD